MKKSLSLLLILSLVLSTFSIASASSDDAKLSKIIPLLDDNATSSDIVYALDEFLDWDEFVSMTVSRDARDGNILEVLIVKETMEIQFRTEGAESRAVWITEWRDRMVSTPPHIQDPFVNQTFWYEIPRGNLLFRVWLNLTHLFRFGHSAVLMATYSGYVSARVGEIST